MPVHINAQSRGTLHCPSWTSSTVSLPKPLVILVRAMMISFLDTPLTDIVKVQKPPPRFGSSPCTHVSLEIRNHLTTKPASIILIEESFLSDLIKYDLHTAHDDSLTPNRGMGTDNRLAGGRVYPGGWTNVPRESQSPSRPFELRSCLPCVESPRPGTPLCTFTHLWERIVPIRTYTSQISLIV